MEKKRFSIEELPRNFGPYEKFCEKYKENLVDTQIDKSKKSVTYSDQKDITEKPRYSVFNINNDTILLVESCFKGRYFLDLTIASNKKSVNETVEKIRSNGFKLEEIV